MNKKLKTKKIIAVSQVISMILEIFAFSFIIGGMAFGVTITSVPEVSALDFGTNMFPMGCCTEGTDGSICLDVNLEDKTLCKNDILLTKCNQVEGCQVGCCYSKEEGICSFNSPKKKCESTNGNWSESPLCQTQECSLGCCILGDEASITTTRECTLKARELNYERAFESRDADGTCNSKTRLQKMGACTFGSGDFSGENDCKFISKAACQTKGGEFYEDYLCTSEILNSTCFKAKNTTCVEGSDKMYYVDTCGNQANIYDSSKYNDQEYWEQIISPEKSCTASPGDGSCGNCDYMGGSICAEYRKGKDSAPVYGNNVCRSTACANGRKNGETWCISDYDLSKEAVAPVGSRNFRGVCMFGEISIEPCADFNQEICQEGIGGTGGAEAKCVTNQWRSCLAANDYDTYADVKTACEDLGEQCVMFLEIEGQQDEEESSPNTNLNSTGSKYENFPGFFTSTGTIVDPLDSDNTITWNGANGDIGADMNGNLPYCVPKYTPGMVFWRTADSNNSNYGLSYGGSYEETKSICSMGNFNCVTKQKKEGTGSQAEYSKVNQICYWNENSSIFVEALNERCRSLGPCGVYVNIAGELGRESTNGSAFSRIGIDENGNVGTWNNTVARLNLSEDYRESLAEKASIINSPGSLLSLTNILFLSLVSGKVTAEETTTATQTTGSAAASQAAAKAPSDPMEWYAALLGLFGAIGAGAGGITSLGGLPLFGSSGVSATAASAGVKATPGSAPTSGLFSSGAGAAPVSGWNSAFSTVGYALVAAAAGYMVGQLTADWFGFDSNDEAKTYSEALALGGASAVIAAKLVMSKTILGFRGLGWEGIGGGITALVVLVIVAYIYYINNVEETKYYVTHYECSPWQAPLKGECSLCNNDVRPCSEYRCKSLGQNCHYFNANGEPGWCAQNDEIWSATITPWKEIITSGYSYIDVGELKFTIASSSGGLVAAGTGIEFGIKTSKQAVCKIDNKHTLDFNSMAYDMVIDDTVGCENGLCVNQGLYHRIALSPYIDGTASTTTASTLKLNKGENEFYIRCQNFAGQSNRAEFVVKVNADEGPDLTPPIINSFKPISGSYVRLGENKSSVTILVNEPSECKYSQGANSRFEEMNNTLSCITDSNSAVLGKWPCYGSLNNLVVGVNKFYFQCRDQPNLLEEQSGKKNINRNSKEYELNVCSMGLNITKISPENQIISGKSPVGVILEAETKGCVNGGDATCYYKFDNGLDIAFKNTGKKNHMQNFTSIVNGTHRLMITCTDKAGNSDNRTTNITVYLDDNMPGVVKSYTLGKQLVVQTDESSQCKFVTNSSIGCSFDYNKDNSTLMTGEGLYHSYPSTNNKDYYIKCGDMFGNVNFDCGIIVRTYSFNKEE